jgi:hypothetical protein
LNEQARQTLTALQRGKIALQGEFVWGSNYTFLVQVEHGAERLRAVYKPTRGARPLWDFPVATLARREVAAFLVSEALGWDLVAPTVYRTQGPFGAGSLQQYIDHDPNYHYFNFRPEDLQRLRPTAVFDLLINNADRKGSHVLIDEADQHLWLIDHGICFHVEDKLRTVIWDFVGEPIPQDLCTDLEHLHQQLTLSPDSPDSLAYRLVKYLSKDEIQALRERAGQLIARPVFPTPDPDRRPFPYPQL